MAETLLSRAELAAVLGVSVRTLDRMRSRGERIVKFRPGIIDDLMAAREEKAGKNGGANGAAGEEASQHRLASWRRCDPSREAAAAWLGVPGAVLVPRER